MANKGCTAFCQEPCEYINKHHPVLLALIQSNSRKEFVKFKEEVKKLELLTSWRKDDPIPDACPEFNYPIVHWAAVMGKVRVLEWCIDEKVDLLCKCGNRSETALHRLVMCGLTALAENSGNVYQLFEDIVDLLEILLDQPDDNHDLPLHVATKLVAEQHGNINQISFDIYSKLVEILAQKTCQMHDDLLDSCNMDGNTPLHILATSDSSLKLVKTLLEYGADMEIKNMEGDTPLEIARANGARRITKLLLKFGKSNRNDIDSNFDESDEDSMYQDSQVSGRIEVSDGDSDIIHHDSDNEDEGDTQILHKCDWPSIRKQSNFVQPCDRVHDDTHLKRKSPNSEVELPMKKKPKERGSVHFSKPLCPTVAISPIQVGSFSTDTNLSQPAAKTCTSNIDKKSVLTTCDMNNNTDKHIIIKKQNELPVPTSGENNVDVLGDGWRAENSGKDLLKAMEEQCNNQNEMQKRLKQNSGESTTSVKSKKGIEDVVKNIKERQESIEMDESNSAKEVCGYVQGGTKRNVEATDHQSVTSCGMRCVVNRKEMTKDGSESINKQTTCTTSGDNCLSQNRQSEHSIANIPQQLHNGKVHQTPDNTNSLEEETRARNPVETADNYETLPEVRVKVENEDLGTSTSSPSGSASDNSLVDVFSQDDLTELLQKTKTKTLKKIERLNGELEDATRNEKMEDQEYTLLQQRIQAQQEYIKRLQEEIIEWTKESNMYLKRKELAIKKKITCQKEIKAEMAKLQTIKKHLNSCM